MELEIKYKSKNDCEDLLLEKALYHKSAHQKDTYFLSGEKR